jgi:hypothetical protein
VTSGGESRLAFGYSSSSRLVLADGTSEPSRRAPSRARTTISFQPILAA